MRDGQKNPQKNKGNRSRRTKRPEKKRELTGKQKLLAFLIGIAVVITVYIIFVDRPIRTARSMILDAKEALQEKLEEVETESAELGKMQREIDGLPEDRLQSYMPSYNASKEEYDFLNETLSAAMDYYVGFGEVTREGDLIRRSFTLQYKAADYLAAVEILRNLENSEIRCQIGNLSMTPEGEGTLTTEPVQVSCAAMFYETMFGGTEDKDLPVDSAAAEDETEAESTEAETETETETEEESTEEEATEDEWSEEDEYWYGDEEDSWEDEDSWDEEESLGFLDRIRAFFAHEEY